MRFSVDRNTSGGTATIGMVGDSEGDPFVDLMLTVSDADAERFRDALIEMYPVDGPAGQNDWRGDDEWAEVSLEEAGPGDVAEFVCTHDGMRYHGRLSVFDSVGLCIRRADFIDGEPREAGTFGMWVVRRVFGEQAAYMGDLHIWRKTDPHRFDEPSEVGVYATRSGLLLYNDGDEPNWRRLDGRGWGNSTFSVYVRWDEVRNELDDSEFPLKHVTEEMVRGMVGGDAE